MAMTPDTKAAPQRREGPRRDHRLESSAWLRWDTAVGVLLIAVLLVGLGTTDGFGNALTCRS